MIYLESHSTDPYFNLALEEYVFERMDRNESYFMLWQNENTIVVGKYQNTAEEIDQEYVRANGIRVARRLSGGGAVYHDSGNLNFTFIVDQADSSDFNFKMFVQPVVETLSRFGVQASCNGRNDVTINGLKFSGNSQYARHGRLLHHGCIMLDSDLSKVTAALRPKAAKFESKSVKSVRSRVTTINAHAPRPISMEAFKQELKRSVMARGEWSDHVLMEDELEEIQTLRKEKYASWEWNFGFFPAYGMRREAKFPAGLVAVNLDAERGRIRKIRFSGDFFGNGEIAELEESLVGLKLDETLEQRLEERNVSHYLHGISAGELAGLIIG